MAIRIQDVTLGLCRQIAEIEQEIIELPWSFDSIVALVDKNNCVFRCICDDDKVIGYYSFSYSFDEADVNNIAVRTDMQNKGYGKMLLMDLIQSAKHKECVKIWLEVNENNAKAIKLYTSCGFEKISIRKKYYKDTDDAIIMCKS